MIRAAGLVLLLLSSGCAGRTLPFAGDPTAPGADLGAPAPDLAAPPHDAAAPLDLTSRADLATPPDLQSPRTWSTYVASGPWPSLINSAAMDSRENLYVSDNANIYVVRNGIVSLYLDATTIGATLPIQSLDVAADDMLFLLAGTTIYRSTGAGQVTLQHDVAAAPSVMWLGVVDDNTWLVLDYYAGGMEKIAGNSETLLYGEPSVQGATGCSSQSLAVQRDGVFFYLPGCNGSPLIKGASDGSGAAVLLQADLTPRLYADNFNSVTRDPAGGFVLSVENNAGSWNNALIQSDDDGNWSEIVTNPPMVQFVNSVVGDLYEFHSRPVTVGPSGAIYVVGVHGIYRLSP